MPSNLILRGLPRALALDGWWLDGPKRPETGAVASENVRSFDTAKARADRGPTGDSWKVTRR